MHDRILPLLASFALAVAGCACNRPCCNPPAEGASAALAPGTLGSTERVHQLGGFMLASQPGEEDFREAAERGVRTVVDQRKSTEQRGFDEITVVQSLGMTYVNPSFSKPEELTDAMFAQTREVMRSAERPILMHCASGNRTGATWLAYRVLDDGVEFDEALAEAKSVGLTSPEYETKARQYIERQLAAK